MQSLKQLARRLKNELYAVYRASRDSRTPWCTSKELTIGKLVAIAIKAIIQLSQAFGFAVSERIALHL
jgi:hypothetical protein